MSAAEEKRALERGSASSAIGQALEWAKKVAPGADARVQAISSRAANTRFARNEITSNGDVDETRLTVTISFGQRHASAETNQVGQADLRAVVERAARLAKLSPEDPEWMPPLPPQTYGPSAPAWDEAAAALDAAARADAIAAAIGAADERRLELAGFYEHNSTRLMIGNSAGLFAEHASTAATFTVTARTPDGQGSGWAGSESHRAGLDAAALARTAMDKALASQKATALAPGRTTVVLEPAAVADLLGFMRGALDARRADEGRSVFSRKGGGALVGDKLFAPAVSLTSDPADAALPTAPFDGDGLPLARTAWIESGVLRALHRSRFWARKTGAAPVGNARALRLASGTASRDELIAGVKRGVLITRFFYLRMLEPRQLLVTGLTRDGIFRIEDGRLAGAVNNFRFNESPAALLRNVEALGKDAARFGGLMVPALRANEFNLASVSAAV